MRREKESAENHFACTGTSAQIPEDFSMKAKESAPTLKCNAQDADGNLIRNR